MFFFYAKLFVVLSDALKQCMLVSQASGDFNENKRVAHGFYVLAFLRTRAPQNIAMFQKNGNSYKVHCQP